MVGFLNKSALALLALGLALSTEGPITIHIAGDSTAAIKQENKRPETGWAEALPKYFSPDKVRIRNLAKNGRSTRTFIEEGLWQQLIDSVKAGDYVFIEFGHNDEVPTKVDRYTPPDQYRANLIRFVNESRAKQAIPVLLTPVSRRKFEKNGTVADSHHEYSEIVRAVAAELHVPLIDMDRKSAALLEIYGAEDSRKLFLQLKPGENPNYPNGVEDNTHFNPAGAAAMARLVIEGMRERQLDLVKYILPVQEDVPEVGRRERGDSLLSAGRIAALAEPLRTEWRAYIAKSNEVRSADKAALANELKEAGKNFWTPAPTDAGFFMDDSMTARWFAGQKAGEVADAIISYQAPNGGWSKRMGFTHVRQPAEAFTSAENETWFSTVDNGATTEELRFLGERITAKSDARYEKSFVRGLAYLLQAQEPNGCWPQIFPLADSYHDAATFNDDATVNALRVLNDAATGKYAFVPVPERVQSAIAVSEGVSCILKTQYLQNGVKTAWGAQHDPLTLLPTKARAYEHASLSGREGAAVVDFLMSLENPSPEVVNAVHAAAAWFQKVAIKGYSYKYKADLTPDPAAKPIWARFYELNTNRPIFSDRDGVIRYSLSEIGPERRYGYGWYTTEPASMLKRYEKWAAKHPAGRK